MPYDASKSLSKNSFGTSSQFDKTSNQRFSNPEISESESHLKSKSPNQKSLNVAMNQLFEMGFWNRELNKEILEKNNCDVNLTINELLNPEHKKNQQKNKLDVVSSQPRHNDCGFEEFD